MKNLPVIRAIWILYIQLIQLDTGLKSYYTFEHSSQIPFEHSQILRNACYSRRREENGRSRELDIYDRSAAYG
jgi:hypothetical protein